MHVTKKQELHEEEKLWSQNGPLNWRMLHLGNVGEIAIVKLS